MGKPRPIMTRMKAANRDRIERQVFSVMRELQRGILSLVNMGGRPQCARTRAGATNSGRPVILICQC